MAYSHINNNNYDFLWTVGFPYLYCSMYLLSGYQNRDFVACQNGYSHTLFVSKKEREKLSELGLKLYTTGFRQYKKFIKEQLIIYKKTIRDIKRQKLSSMTNYHLAQSYKKAVNFCIKIWENYFLTEYHSTDLVSQALMASGREDKGRLSSNIKEMGEMKLRQRYYINQTLYSPNIFERYYKEISKRLKLKHDINNYSFKELLDLLKGKKIFVHDRSKVVVLGKFSAWKDLLGKKAITITNQLLEVKKSTNEFTGKIGNKGYYRGYVKVIHFSVETDFKKEINEMKKGEILVSGSTGPEMILACKKAGAIITDEGGIISHAAIISRELNIPSVIGTRIATKVLHDGDLVEVDAERGVVRILKRAQS
jgi:phosphohistidine swiveling domain-containing protein